MLDQLIWCLRLEFIKGIDDHATSEYIRLFKQCVLNSRIPLMDKASSVIMDATSRFAEMVSLAVVFGRVLLVALRHFARVLGVALLSPTFFWFHTFTTYTSIFYV